MVGDVLRARIKELRNTTNNKRATDSFWVKLRDIATEEIIVAYPSKIDSDIIIPLYFKIMSENIENIPEYFRATLSSNKQPRFRVVNRNLFTSNAFHPDGLANQKGIIAKKIINPARKGQKIIYQGEGIC